MKRDVLEAMGLDKETIDKIMVENNSDIEREKGKAALVTADRDAIKQQLEGVQGQLKAFEGVDVKELRGEITALQGKLTADANQYKADLARRDIESQTALFLAEMNFVNAATREYYAGKLNGALGDPVNVGKSRSELFDAMTKGEDGKPLPNIIAEDTNPRVHINQPPVQPIPPGKLQEVTGQMASLSDTMKTLNAHRLIQ